MNVFQSPVVKLDYDSISKQLVQTWTGFASSVQFKEGIDKTVSFAAANPVVTLISDTLNQSVVAMEDTKYAASAMPTLFQHGLKAMAFVMPKNALTQLSLKQFSTDKKTENIQYFSSILEAKKWLATVK